MKKYSRSKLIFTFVSFAMLLISCPHKKDKTIEPKKKPLPPANPILKGTVWETKALNYVPIEEEDKHTISFSDSVSLATIQLASGMSIEAPYEVKDEQIEIKLDNYISKLEHFGEKDFVEFFKTRVVEQLIKDLKMEMEDPGVPHDRKKKLQDDINKLESGFGYLTNKAGMKKYHIEILLPIMIKYLEELIANPDVSEEEKKRIREELAQMKLALSNPTLLDLMIEGEYGRVQEAINNALPDIRKSNPMTLKCEKSKTLDSTSKLISSAVKIDYVVPSPADIAEGEEFIKKK